MILSVGPAKPDFIMIQREIIALLIVLMERGNKMELYPRALCVTRNVFCVLEVPIIVRLARMDFS